MTMLGKHEKSVTDGTKLISTGAGANPGRVGFSTQPDAPSSLGKRRGKQNRRRPASELNGQSYASTAQRVVLPLLTMLRAGL